MTISYGLVACVLAVLAAPRLCAAEAAWAPGSVEGALLDGTLGSSSGSTEDESLDELTAGSVSDPPEVFDLLLRQLPTSLNVRYDAQAPCDIVPVVVSILPDVSAEQ